ncbi:MAG: tRNA pseudouridine(55) synthase TruB [Clostridia bacterium]|nr:tRNA pseudouridine(55) synthase TruB [Clostridia bacterium]
MTGILIVDKPKDWTSFDIVAKIRRISGEKKVGHSGTLDPMATGVMTLLLGGATGFADLLPVHDKEYIADLKLGIITDTLDITGKVIENREFDISKEEFADAAFGFTGEITQIPPMYSAVSVNGERLYKIARRGETAERPERRVKIEKLEILESDEKNGHYRIFVACSSGTYIRTLISDIGEKLGCGAVMTDLRRVKANGFTLSDSIGIAEIKGASQPCDIEKHIIPVDSAFQIYQGLTVSEAQARRFSNGGELFTDRLRDCKAEGLYRVYSPGGDFLGLGSNNGDGALRIVKVFVNK